MQPKQRNFTLGERYSRACVMAKAPSFGTLRPRQEGNSCATGARGDERRINVLFSAYYDYSLQYCQLSCSPLWTRPRATIPGIRQAGQSATASRRQRMSSASRKTYGFGIDHQRRVKPALEKVDNILRRRDGHAFRTFPGQARRMRRQNHLVQTRQRMALQRRLVLIDINAGRRDFALAERFGKSRLVNNTAARRVDDDRSRLHAP